MVISRPKQTRLSKSDWINAALEVIAVNGIDGVSVEALAVRLGVTKGSFYWHFKDRSELISVALSDWAIHRTKERIDELHDIVDPRQRLQQLVAAVGTEIDPIDLQLIASTGDPHVSSPLQQHHRMWLDFAETVYLELGCTESEASLRALFAYSSYIGLVVLDAAAPSNTSPLANATPEEIMDTLLPGP